MKEETIISAIHLKYIDEYLCEISDFKDQTTYYGDNWSIEVIQKEARQMGKLTFPLNHIVFRANDDVCKQLVYKFRMKFMSAGA
ncbi:MAG: hypothetical protein WBA54_00570 [Acidaminobacteraceae bacterium]